MTRIDGVFLDASFNFARYEVKVMEHPKKARVVYDHEQRLLIGVVEDDSVYKAQDPRDLAELLFAAGVRHGYVYMPDWREGDIAPATGHKIALNHRLVQLGFEIDSGLK
jgi:hypothetical protein